MSSSNRTDSPVRLAELGVERVIATRTRDLGEGFQVRRALPAVRRRMVGPFIFLDQMGPVLFGAGQGLDVPPHPHIGLATLTYLFEGEIIHRDSLGVVQAIRPGEVNWMTAGRGIAHSERTSAERRIEGERVSGVQCWLALPRAHEEVDPAFHHHAAGELPVLDRRGARVRLIAGTLLGERSPVATFSDTIYADLTLEAEAQFTAPAEHEERALYVAGGSVTLGEAAFAAGSLLVLRPGVEVAIAAPEAARLLLLGGAPMDGPRHIWWNFVSSSEERIEQARRDWHAGSFAPVPDETERIPLPGEPPPPVIYP